eukprot:TRINITY_DN10874_c1_g1_i1.p1 TRINITY_DN10874_c1_g1~~TRINITY_DN10874_c1_g1_i1.p1  ORF type:complete len:329 (+),score=64.12 TRINITY_DN10874_c1_g1_i1:28-987(+)
MRRACQLWRPARVHAAGWLRRAYCTAANDGKTFGWGKGPYATQPTLHTYNMSEGSRELDWIHGLWENTKQQIKGAKQDVEKTLTAMRSVQVAAEVAAEDADLRKQLKRAKEDYKTAKAALKMLHERLGKLQDLTGQVLKMRAEAEKEKAAAEVVRLGKLKKLETAIRGSETVVTNEQLSVLADLEVPVPDKGKGFKGRVLENIRKELEDVETKRARTVAEAGKIKIENFDVTVSYLDDLFKDASPLPQYNVFNEASTKAYKEMRNAQRTIANKTYAAEMEIEGENMLQDIVNKMCEAEMTSVAEERKSSRPLPTRCAMP